MNICETKAEMRKRIETLRNALSASERRRKSANITERLLEHLSASIHRSAGSSPAAVFSYMPFRSEVDVTPVIEWCWSHGVPVVVPRVLPGQKQLKLHEVYQYEDMEIGSWGIREPKPSMPVWDNASRIHTIIIPGVAFDSRMGRLGYGGGYYDRFLERLGLANMPRPFIAAPAFDLQIVDEIPMEAHDFRVDRIMTETRTMKKDS